MGPPDPSTPTRRPASALRHSGSLSQLPWDLTPALRHAGPHTASHVRNRSHSSRLTLDMGLPGLQPPTLETSSAHPWTSTSPGTPQDSTDSNLMTQLHPPVAGSLHTGRAWQPTGLGAGHAYQTTHSSQPATTEGPTQPT